MNLRIPEVWELLDRFKDRCRSKGWKVADDEDWIRTADNKYHNFLWSPTVHPSTFERIVTNHKCAIRKGISYQIVDVSYTAWLFPQRPLESLMQTLRENPKLSKRTAIYDLSWLYAGKPLCLKLNETNSIVFREFERFLKETCGAEVKLVKKPQILKT